MQRYRHFTSPRLIVLPHFSQFVVKKIVFEQGIPSFLQTCKSSTSIYAICGSKNLHKSRRNVGGTTRANAESHCKNIAVIRKKRLLLRFTIICGVQPFYRWKIHRTNMHRNYRAYNESLPRTSRSILCGHFLRLIDYMRYPFMLIPNDRFFATPRSPSLLERNNNLE